MDPSDWQHFQDLITAKLAALDEEDLRGQDGQSVVTLDQQAVGRLSRQDALLSQSMAKATQARRNVQRTALQSALNRIDEGEFGYCDGCGDDIPIKRLELDPTVRRCISCATG